MTLSKLVATNVSQSADPEVASARQREQSPVLVALEEPNTVRPEVKVDSEEERKKQAKSITLTKTAEKGCGPEIFDSSEPGKVAVLEGVVSGRPDLSENDSSENDSEMAENLM